MRRQAIEVWSAIADQESYRSETECFNIIKQSYQEVVELLVKNLEAIEEENEDLFDSSNIDIS